MNFNRRINHLNNIFYENITLKITSKIKQHSLYKPDGITKGGIPLWSKISKYIVNKPILPSGGESLLVSL
jgi:hypothetical protein